MKKVISAVILIIFLGSGTCGAVFPVEQTQRFQVSFSNLMVNDTGEGLMVNLEGANEVFLKPGYYMVPSRVETFTFPFGTVINSVVCTPRNIHRQSLIKELQRAPDPILLDGSVPAKDYQPKTEPVAVNSWHAYYVGTGFIHDEERGVILKVQMFPVQYHLEDHQIEWAEDMEVRITYTEPQPPITFNEEYRLLVLAPTEFKNELQPLITHKNNRGVPTKLVTLDDIYNGTYFTVSGRDDQEKIKYFIENAVGRWGISYVLLVGDSMKFPARTTHVLESSYNFDGVFLSDLYYADIFDAQGAFSTWDTNNNDVFGEYRWGPSHNTDKIDLYPDVYLGRLTCRNLSEVTICVNKIIVYETNKAYTQDWFTNFTTIGGDTFPGSIDPEGIDEGEYASQAAINVMTGFTPKYLWASNGNLTSRDPTGVQKINNAINDGAGYVFFSGHGNEYSYATHPHNKDNKWIPYPGSYTYWDVDALRNGNKLPIVILSACSCGKYNVRYFCICWSFLINTRGGAIASFGATSLAWGGIGHYETELCQGKLTLNMFKTVKNATTLGEMWGNAIAMYFPVVWGEYDYVTLEQWQQFGDPSLAIKEGSSQQPPTKPTTPNGPPSGIIHKQYTYNASARDPDGDMVSYLFDWGDGEFSGVGPYASNVTANAKHTWNERGDFQIKARAKDEHGMYGPWSDPLNIHIFSPCLNISMNCGLGVNLNIKNTGDLAATNVTYTLTVNGGVMDQLHRSWNRTILSLAANEEKIWRTGLFFGVGVITIQATVTCGENISPSPLYTEAIQIFLITIKKTHPSQVIIV